MDDRQERNEVIEQAAREIHEMGFVAFDTFMSVERLRITPEDVADRMVEIIEREEDKA